MNKLSVIILFQLVAFKTFSQPVITGRITDNKKKTIAGISVGIVNSYDGATTDSNGHFRFKLSEKIDSITIYASSVGYKKYEQKMAVTSLTVVADIVLVEEITELKAVVISAGSFEASDQKRNAVLKRWMLPPLPVPMQMLPVPYEPCRVRNRLDRVKGFL